MVANGAMWISVTVTVVIDDSHVFFTSTCYSWSVPISSTFRYKIGAAETDTGVEIHGDVVDDVTTNEFRCIAKSV